MLPRITTGTRPGRSPPAMNGKNKSKSRFGPSLRPRLKTLNKNHIKEILFALTDGGVEFVIGGGVAAVLHGVERVTMDIDIAVNLTPENLQRLILVVDELGLRPRVPVPLKALGDPEAIRMKVEQKHALVFSLIDPRDPLRYVDIFLKDDLAYATLQPDAVSVVVDGRTLWVVSAVRLLAIKKAIQPPREKDRMDIAVLEAIVRKNLS